MAFIGRRFSNQVSQSVVTVASVPLPHAYHLPLVVLRRTTMTLHDRYPITSAATRLIRRPAVRALITLVWLLVALGGLLSLQTFLGELKVCRYQAL